jgi:hypothetical protein
MAIDVVLKLDDIGLFKKRRKREIQSQYERAVEVRDQFAECMQNALRYRYYCVMPDLCARGNALLSCNHLLVDYANFTGHGIPLTGQARRIIDARLRAIGTLVYREQSMFPTGALAGDIHLPALNRISHFTGGARKAGARSQTRKATSGKSGGGLLGRLFGLS